MKFLLLTILVVVSNSLTEKVKYDKYALYRVTPQDDEAFKMLKHMHSVSKFSVNFWTLVRSIGTPVDIMVPPKYKKDFENLMDLYTVNSEVMIGDIQPHIDSQVLRKKPLMQSANGLLDWDNYHTLREIYAWLDQLAKDYPSQVTLFDAGKTYENRVIKGIKVSFDKQNENRSIFIESNVHAREWISGAVSTYILNEILTNKNASFRQIVDSFDWYFTPITNPDGYEYTHTTDRFWRKTRKPYGYCYGADPNRNFDYKWNQGGSENDPCSEVYAGSAPESEIEIQTLSKTLSKIANKLKVYISFHAYSQLLMVPYGHTPQKLDNYNVTVPLARKAAAALAKRYGTKYTVGNIAETVYVATGSSVDWIKGKYHVPYAYAYELRDTGRYGFLLPPNLIIPTAVETLDSVLVILEGAKQDQY